METVVTIAEILKSKKIGVIESKFDSLIEIE
jgi:hypothetical protein